MKDELLKNKAGIVQIDMRDKPLRIDQHVLVMGTVSYANSRGSVYPGRIVGFSRQVIVLKGEYDEADVNALIKFYDDKANKRFKCPDWEEMKRRGIDNLRTEGVSSCYLIGCTESTAVGWKDGSLFE